MGLFTVIVCQIRFVPMGLIISIVCAGAFLLRVGFGPAGVCSRIYCACGLVYDHVLLCMRVSLGESTVPAGS